MKKLSVLLSAALVFLTACLSYPVGYGPDLIQPIAVMGEAHATTARVGYGNVAGKRIMSAVVRVHSEAVLFTGTGGILGELHAWPGDVVTEGQLIASLNVELLQERYDAQAQRIANMRRMNGIRNDELQLEIDKLELMYTNTLWAAAEALDADAIEGVWQIRDRIVWATLELEHARATQALDLQDQEIILANYRDAMAYTNIYSPMSGVVTAIGWRGQWLRNRSPVMRIACNVEPHIFLEDISLRNELHYFRGMMRLQGHYRGQMFDLELISPTPAQHLSYRRQGLQPSVRFDFVCGNPPPVGTIMELHYYTVWYENVLRVPQRAIFGDESVIYGEPLVNPFVYKIVDGQRIETPVEISNMRLTTTYVAVFGGLQEGDEIYVGS